jgi:ABC-type enterochelin transport system permease subunit
MADYPYSIFGYVFVGTIGSLVFLYLLLLYEKNLRILDNEFTSPFIA